MVRQLRQVKTTGPATSAAITGSHSSRDQSFLPGLLLNQFFARAYWVYVNPAKT
jgi:hypothetical protein